MIILNLNYSDIRRINREKMNLSKSYYTLVVFRRYAPGSYVLFLHEYTIHVMVVVKNICSKI